MSQPPPVPGQKPVVTALVEALLERSDAGLKTYGLRLATFNGRSALQDATEEALDLAVYLQQEQMERAALEAHIDVLDERLARRDRARKTHFAKSRRQRKAYASLQRYVERLRKQLSVAELGRRMARESSQNYRQLQKAQDKSTAADLAGTFAEYFRFLNETGILFTLSDEDKSRSQGLLQRLLEKAIEAGASLT